MQSNDITLEVLRSIRDAVRDTNARLDQTNARLDETNTRLEEQTGRLDWRFAESELRTTTALCALKGSIDDVKSLLETRLDVRDRVDRCEREIELIKSRLAG